MTISWHTNNNISFKEPCSDTLVNQLNLVPVSFTETSISQASHLISISYSTDP